ncbi:HNH endonuclease [Streptomyces sp. NPDC004129]
MACSALSVATLSVLARWHRYSPGGTGRGGQVSSTVQSVIRRDRGEQPLWVWVAVLTAHERRCTYCDEEQSVTLEHEMPLSTKGRDIWWNLVPACDRCNRWKSWKSASRWKIDMEMEHRLPGAGFARNKLPLRTVMGIPARVTEVQREIQDSARLRWFEHHYGHQTKPRLRREVHKRVQACLHELERYPYPPWTSPETCEASDRCTRRLCCGYTHPDAWFEFIILPKEKREELRRAAYDKGLYVGDLLGHLVQDYLAERTKT